MPKNISARENIGTKTLTIIIQVSSFSFLFSLFDGIKSVVFV